MDVLEKKIQCQGQQGCVLFLSAVAGHKKEQQDHQKISGVKVTGEQLSEKAGDAGVFRFTAWPGSWPGWRYRTPGRFRCRTGYLRWFWGGLGCLYRCRSSRRDVLHSSALVGSISLGDVAVVHRSPPGQDLKAAVAQK